MTKSTITRERAQQIFLGNGPEPSASEERELARMALAAMDSEPVAVCIVEDGQMCPDGFGECDHSLPDGTHELFAAPQPAPVVPDGYVMVPKEPTEEMLQASYREAAVYSPTAYRAMIASAPQEDKP